MEERAKLKECLGVTHDQLGKKVMNAVGDDVHYPVIYIYIYISGLFHKPL